MSKMKYSGVEWIGDIPNEWNINKLKNVADIYTGNSISDDDKSLYEDPVDAYPYIATKDISLLDAIVNYDNGMFTKRRDKKFKIAYSGDTLLCIEGGSAGKKIAKINCDVSFVNKLCCFHGTSINNVYLYYYLMSDSFREKFNQNIFGLIGGVSQFVLKQFSICIPNDFEQKLIANFLDKKINELDGVLNDLNRQLEILSSYKNSIITENVTLGLKKSVIYKKSNINFINKIPNSWKETRILDVLSMPITDGPHETPDLYDSGIPFVSAEAVSFGNGKIDFNHIRGHISVDYYKQCCKKYKPMINDIYMIKSGATTGKVALVETDKKFTIWSPLAVFRANDKIINYKFLFYTLNSNYFQLSVQNNWSYGTQQNIGMRVLEHLKIALPPLDEQKEIVEYLDKKCNQIDKIIEDKQKQIDKIEEYKKSVIYEYVTGKKRVEGAEKLYG